MTKCTPVGVNTGCQLIHLEKGLPQGFLGRQKLATTTKNKNNQILCSHTQHKMRSIGDQVELEEEPNQIKWNTLAEDKCTTLKSGLVLYQNKVKKTHTSVT